MDQLRYEAEVAAFQKYGLPSRMFRFFDRGTPNEHLVMAAMTNRKNVYTLYIELCDFPNRIPRVFVKTMLRDRNGNNLDSASGGMHTLPSAHGWTRICHYGFDSWKPSISLYKVYVKCRLWLEMYELHLQTGKSIDYYLSHQA